MDDDNDVDDNDDDEYICNAFLVVIVPVHAMLECENLDDIETQIVNKMTQGANDLMTDASSEQRHRLIAALYLNVIAFRRGKGIVIYTSCSKEEEFVHLCEIIDNLEMRNILQQLFNLLVSNVKIKVVLVDVLSKDIAKAKQIFDGGLTIRSINHKLL